MRATRSAEAPAPRAPAPPPAPDPGPASRFDVAASRAMARYTPAEWALLEPSRRTQAIYAELRRVDSEVNPRPPRARTAL